MSLFWRIEKEGEGQTKIKILPQLDNSQLARRVGGSARDEESSAQTDEVDYGAFAASDFNEVVGCVVSSFDVGFLGFWFSITQDIISALLGFGISEF